MTLTDLFVRRPVLASVVSLLILLIGLRAIGLLELREYPETKSTVISVTTAYPGADSALIQSFISTPLQRAISEASGIDYLQATSTQGLSVIEAHMALNYDPSAAVAEIQAKVASQRGILPEEADDPVIDVRTAQGFALMYLAFYSEDMSPSAITDYLVRAVLPKIQAIPGVSKVQINGNQSFAMRIWLDPVRMAALGVTAADVRDAVRDNNFTAGVGKTKGDLIAINLSSTTDISDTDSFRNLVIRSTGDTMVRLRDVADVELGALNYDLTSWYNGQMAIMVAVEAAPGANPLTVSEQVHKILPEIERQLPGTLKVALPHDGSEYIKASINEVIRTLAEAVAIVLVVIFLSLGSWQAAIVPAVSVPLSLIGGAFVMLVLGFSINLLTLLAMLLAIGLVVDDAIVVVENVHRHILAGETPFDAALKGARELALPIVSMTTTLLAVYAPIGFMGGLVGTLFAEFAFTLAGAVLVSGIVALTLSPMLSSKVLKASGEPHGFEAAVERFFQGLAQRYQRLLARSLGERSAMLFFSLVVLLSIPVMFATTRSELAPTEDREVLNIQAIAPETATMEYTKAYARQMVDTFKTIPEYSRSFLLLGGGGTPATSFGGFRLVPANERHVSQDAMQALLQGKLNAIAGLQIGVFTFPALPGSPVGPPVQFVITTDQDFAALDELADTVIGAAMQSGAFIFLNKSTSYQLPQTRVVIDRERAGALGIDMKDIGLTLATLLGGNNVNRFSLEGRSYEVIPQVARKYRGDTSFIDNYYVRAHSGELVPLSGLVHFEKKIEPTKRTQFQQLNALTVNGVMAPGTSMGQALATLEGIAARAFPPEFNYDFMGASRQYVQQGSALVTTFFLSIVVIYLVLAAQFESWRDPLIILVSVPMSIAGALIFLTLGLATINIYTQVGLITLIGLIAKNGILIVDFANRLQVLEGLDKRQAVEKAAAIRLRPILMTTVAMIVAVVPLLLASGPGATSRLHIGLVIATGLGIGTLFTLFVVPGFYLLLGRELKAAPKPVLA